MQHAYVEGYLHIAQFAGRASFATWLTKIAVHEALARLRRRGRELLSDPIAESDEDMMSTLKSARPDPEQQAPQGEARVLLEAAIEALPVSYRSVFVMGEVEGLSTAETAQCLDLSDEAVKTRLHRARALLRKELLERAGVAAPTAFSFHRGEGTGLGDQVAGGFEPVPDVPQQHSAQTPVAQVVDDTLAAGIELRAAHTA